MLIWCKHAKTKCKHESLDKIFFFFFLAYGEKLHLPATCDCYIKQSWKMGKIRQKKKNRSGLPKARPKNNGVIKSGRKKVNVLGNAIIADNWYMPLQPRARGVNAYTDLGTETRL